MYNELSDNRLIALYKDGDADAFAEICDRYRELVKGISRAYFLVGGDGDDLLQEGLLGLLKAVNAYDENGGASFPTFARLCVESNVKTAVKRSRNKGNVPLNDAVSIFECLGVLAPDNPEDKVLVEEREENSRRNLTKDFRRAKKPCSTFTLKGCRTEK